MSKAVKAYKCDWCSRCFGRKQNADRHEKSCSNNPDRHHCKTCIHGVMGIVDEIEAPIGSYPGYDVYGAYCNYHDKPIRDKPYYIDCGTENNGGWGPEYPLPGTCIHYEYKGKAGWTVINDKVKGANK